LLQKETKERMALMPDEDFEGDFLEVQENNHGITLQVRLERRRKTVYGRAE
jgi:hypothetical protein